MKTFSELKGENMSRKLVLGLDIGITSVGWGIIDLETDKVVDAGVRLFLERNAEDNLKRRTRRSGRRLIRRRRQRIEDLKKLLLQYKIIDDAFKPLANPYCIRKNGVRGKLTNEELATALLHLVKRRGSVLDTIEDDATKADAQGVLKQTLTQNEKLLEKSDIFICDLQIARKKERGYIRGTDNLFKVDSYVKEAQAIMSHSGVSSEFMNNVLQILQRKREYYEGPGSEQSPTPYGRFILVRGKVEKIDLIEKMRGKCSVYINEPRAPRMSFSADLFNLLNDINNLKIHNKEITPEHKKEIIENYILKKGSITPKELLKFLQIEEEQKVEGFRVDKSEKPILTEFKGYKLIKKVVEDHKLSKEILQNIKVLDAIAEILTKTKGYQERVNELLALEFDCISHPAAIALSNISGITGYHALSLKAIKEINEEMMLTNLNQMQIITNKAIDKTKKYKGLSAIPIEDEEITNPVVKRAYREAIKVINAARKRHGEFSDIVIEMAREKNSAEQRKKIKDLQGIGENLNKEAAVFANEFNVPLNLKLKHKIRFYLQQDCKCVYCGKPIEIYSMMNDPYAYEIDHIIPISVSLDDSMNNKVVVHRSCNQKKGNSTPFHYFLSGVSGGWSYDEYKNFVYYLKQSNKINRRKMYNLLFEKDITKFSVLKEFIERNLVDTRYASREIMSKLNAYYKANEIKTSVHSVKGQITDMFRKKAQIQKDRENFSHHAVDALIVAAIKKKNLLSNYFDIQFDRTKNIVTSRTTGEIIHFENEAEFFDEDLIRFISHLRNLEPKLSHKVDRKPNRQFADETIYAARKINGEFMRMSKLKDIYGKDGIKLADFIRGGKDEKILMAKEDPRTFDLLKRIVFETPITNESKEKNPFAIYKNEHGLLRKYSKKGNGPIVKSITYIEEKLGNHMDISSKYTLDTQKTKVVQLQIKPYRIDVYNDDGKYKFVTIRYQDLKPAKNEFIIDLEKYEELKKLKKISTNAVFLFSLHKNEVFEVTKDVKGKHVSEICRFVATNNDLKNAVQIRPLERHFYQVGEGVEIKNQIQTFLTISKNIVGLRKIHLDILGNVYYLQENENLSLRIKI